MSDASIWPTAALAVVQARAARAAPALREALLARAQSRQGPSLTAQNAALPTTTGSPRGTPTSLGALRSLSAQLQSQRPTGTAADELAAVDALRARYADLSRERRIAASLHVPADAPEAGPLNSQRLMTEAMQRMAARSPAYLGEFVAWADALLWLEQAGNAGALQQLATTRTIKKPRRAPVRTPR